MKEQGRVYMKYGFVVKHPEKGYIKASARGFSEENAKRALERALMFRGEGAKIVEKRGVLTAPQHRFVGQ